ncbi:YceI family protein [Glaciecola petra]|uniref:YceI family protein n=1 Tax=Glaciecola petra TaxID=3075602 RepID=A0ABU2ZU88_9ALTE|nr:YceI family protein [Aestuariibacter sp. P117]MDT0595884.1 YceI family protein [Aestuariibacter sp. P117]
MPKISQARKLHGRLCIFLMLFTVFSVSNLGYAFDTFKANNQSSSVSFSGEHAGMKFEGEFTSWQATLNLPPSADPSADPSVTASFDMQSAKTGDSVYDSTLPEADWFDTENHPKGTFTSESVIVVGDAFEVTGSLTIKGISNPVSFTLIDDGAWLSAAFSIDRIAHNIGVESDPDAEWVSRQIAMKLRIKKSA